MSTSTSLNDASTSAYDRGEVISSHKKVSTSCAQKVEGCNIDSASDNTASNKGSGIDAVSDSLGRLDISSDNNDDDDDDDDDEDEKMAISDEKLFQDPPPKEDCLICMLPMPFSNIGLGVTTIYMPCCGKIICEGCSMAEDDEIEKGNIKPWCSCCRVPLPNSDEEYIERCERRMKLNDAQAFCQLGGKYWNGDMIGLPQDKNKAIEMFERAAEFGSCNANYKIAIEYFKGTVVELDIEKSIHHYKLAAIGGHELARNYLGAYEESIGNVDRAMKHHIIAARSGFEGSLVAVGHGYKAGYVRKDEYAAILRASVCGRDEE